MSTWFGFVRLVNTVVIIKAVPFIVVLEAHASLAGPFAKIHLVVVALADCKLFVLIEILCPIGIRALNPHIVLVLLAVIIFEEQTLFG